MTKHSTRWYIIERMMDLENPDDCVEIDGEDVLEVYTAIDEFCGPYRFTEQLIRATQAGIITLGLDGEFASLRQPQTGELFMSDCHLLHASGDGMLHITGEIPIALLGERHGEIIQDLFWSLGKPIAERIVETAGEIEPALDELEHFADCLEGAYDVLEHADILVLDEEGIRDLASEVVGLLRGGPEMPRPTESKRE